MILQLVSSVAVFLVRVGSLNVDGVIVEGTQQFFFSWMIPFEFEIVLLNRVIRDGNFYWFSHFCHVLETGGTRTRPFVIVNL